MLSGAVCRVRGRTLLVIRIGSQWVWKNSLIRLWWHQKLTLWPLGLGSAEGCRFPEDPWTCELLPRPSRTPGHRNSGKTTPLTVERYLQRKASARSQAHIREDNDHEQNFPTLLCLSAVVGRPSEDARRMWTQPICCPLHSPSTFFGEWPKSLSRPSQFGPPMYFIAKPCLTPGPCLCTRKPMGLRTVRAMLRSWEALGQAVSRMALTHAWAPCRLFTASLNILFM